MRIFISTGEVSGDLQGAILADALKRKAEEKKIDLELVGLGGKLMERSGVKLLANTASIGSVGIFEALPFIIPTLQNQKATKKYLQENKIDRLILIDYAAPNMAIGQYTKKALPQIPIVYYIAPQDWAVPMLGNAPKLSKFVDRLLAIFPEEAQYYKSKGINVTWVGHPLLDRIKNIRNRDNARKLLNLELDRTIITLFPASRQQEIKYMLPIIAQTANLIQQQIPNIKFLIPLSIETYRSSIESAIKKYNLSATIITQNKLESIAASDLSIAKSGTVNLEIALLNIPQVVFYRINPITASIGRNLLKIKVPLMSPVNLIVDRQIVPELQQESATPQNIANKALELLQNKNKREQLTNNYQQMRQLLGESGVSDRAAEEIFNL